MSKLFINTHDKPYVLLAAAAFLTKLANNNGEPCAPPKPAIDIDGASGPDSYLSDGSIVEFKTAGAITHPGDVSFVESTLNISKNTVPLTPIANLTLQPTPVPTASSLDDSGRPWDERIDSSSEKKNADGTWKARRGVDKATRAAVLAELVGGAIPGQPVTCQTPPQPSAAEVFGSAGTAPAIAQTHMGTPADQPLTWQEVLIKISAAHKADTNFQAKALSWLQAPEVGVQKIALLANRPDLFAPFVAAMGI